MEVGALQDNVPRCLVSAASFSSKDSGNAHGFLSIADAEVMLAQYVVFAVEGREVGTLGLRAHHDAVAFHHVGIEAMHRLPIGQHDVIGDVDDIVDGAQAHHAQFLLQPFRALPHVAVGDAQTCITLASLRVLYFHVDGKVLVVDHKLAAVGSVQSGLIAILLQPGVEVARHTIVAQGIGAVGGKIYLYHPVALQMVIFSGRLPHRGVVGQNDDAIMARTHAYLILGTNHAQRLHAAKLRLLDGELFVAIIQNTAQIGYDDLLTCSHIGCAAHNLLRLAFAKVYCSDVEMV